MDVMKSNSITFLNLITIKALDRGWSACRATNAHPSRTHQHFLLLVGQNPVLVQEYRFHVSQVVRLVWEQLQLYSS
jgi:hypothetical protein